MLRNLLTLIFITGSLTTIAQVRNASITPVERPAKKNAVPTIDYKLMGAPMPALVLETYVDSSRLKTANAGNEKEKKRKELKQFMTNDDLENKANLFVMMFNPTCSHCQDETQMLERNADLFKKTKLVLLANKGMKSYIQNFISSMKTEDYPMIYVGTDSGTFLSNVFLYSSLPQINIYDRKRKLMKTFTGEVPIDSLEKYIQ